ncbi:hypothetical protein SmJEL517_g02906 [Synchytrium microbalum]|uniref:Uncharacterized protein n=1 Tax=Synchytrium microbalum TaxID=1806994 RepID=A0A507C977_9FUNG|nr:uncharacterized protein SmJEL517_g02906 [Synchytrium microbalum]TPX34524.1 hypothetical protein SmJEL517_g02906 [Synchytrium microbalum]
MLKTPSNTTSAQAAHQPLLPQIPSLSSITTTQSTSNTVTATQMGKRKRKLEKQSLDYIGKSMLAGGIAGCAAKTVIAPLDRVKILFQTANPHFERYAGSMRGAGQAMREIVRNNGYLALFQGHSATLLRIFPYAAVKYMAYEQYKAILMPTPADKSHIRNMIAGSMAGVTSVFVSYPLDLLRVRLAFQSSSQRTSIVDTMSSIYHEPNPFFRWKMLGGVSNFYRGFFPTVYGMIPYAGVSFLTYESLKTWCMDSVIGPWAVINWDEFNNQPKENTNGAEYVKPQLRVWAYLSSGALSGMVAQASSYPLEVIRRNMQVDGVRHTAEARSNSGNRIPSSSSSSASINRTTLQTAKWIYARKGIPGFFVGLSIGFVKVGPMFAVSFYVYEYMKHMLDID